MPDYRSMYYRILSETLDAVDELREVGELLTKAYFSREPITPDIMADTMNTLYNASARMKRSHIDTERMYISVRKPRSVVVKKISRRT